jgi:hypothetical protein
MNTEAGERLKTETLKAESWRLAVGTRKLKTEMRLAKLPNAGAAGRIRNVAISVLGGFR